MHLEQQADQAIPKEARTSLWLHLRYCPYCSRYAKQTVEIAEWARASATALELAGPSLPEAAKERMRALLTAAE